MELIGRPQRRGRAFRRAQRAASGVALIFVLTTIAILTAIGVDFAYNSRVNFELAVQSRDALRARNLAVSGMNMSRFLLHFQGQLDQVTSTMGGNIVQMLMALMPSIDPTQLELLCVEARIPPQNCLKSLGATLNQNQGSSTPGGASVIQLWKVADKFNSNMVFNFLNSFPTPSEKKVALNMGASSGSSGIPIEANFGEFSGTFEMKLTDEDQKVNVQRLGGTPQTGGLPLVTLLQLKGLVDNPKYDFMFNEEDANRDKVSRNDTFVALHDWVDPGQIGWALDPTLTTGQPFTPGSGDKNGPYSRYKPRYKAKNARFDSVDELRMVYGVNDNFMAAFGDHLTVYSSLNGKINVNTDNLEQLWADILSVAKNPLDPIFLNPLLPQVVMLEIQMRKHMLPFIGITSNDFLAMLQADGIDVNPQMLQKNSALNNQASTFRIVSTGIAGRVKKTLTAVLQYDQGMGQLMYWHEE
jgi:general secretion pathway protein K